MEAQSLNQSIFILAIYAENDAVARLVAFKDLKCDKYATAKLWMRSWIGAQQMNVDTQELVLLWWQREIDNATPLVSTEEEERHNEKRSRNV